MIFKNTAAKFIVFAFDATTNVPKTGDAANITAYVSKDYGTVTVLADTTATEMDATNAPGYYLFDAAQAETNADILLVSGKSSTSNIKVIGAPAVIFTRPTTNFLAPATLNRTLVVDASGLADANMVKAGPTGAGTAQTARDLGASVLLSPGTGTGQVDITSGVIKSNLVQILGTALTETAGQIAAAFKKLFDVASPVLTATSVNQTGDAYARLGAPAGASTAADIAAINAKTTNLPAAPASTTNITAASGVSLSSAGIQAIWDAATSALSTVGSIGKWILDKLDVVLSTRLATSGYTAPDNTSITAIKAKTDNIPASPAAVSDIPTANQNADALLDRTDGVETGVTVRKSLRLANAANGGKVDGAATTTIHLRDIADSKNRVTATVDSDGNRTAVTLDLT